MFEYDICLCGSRECPERYHCLRAALYDAPGNGIQTVSLLAPVCNKDNGYESFIKMEVKDYERITSRVSRVNRTN